MDLPNLHQLLPELLARPLAPGRAGGRAPRAGGREPRVRHARSRCRDAPVSCGEPTLELDSSVDLRLAFAMRQQCVDFSRTRDVSDFYSNGNRSRPAARSIDERPAESSRSVFALSWPRRRRPPRDMRGRPARPCGTSCRALSSSWRRSARLVSCFPWDPPTLVNAKG